MIKDFVFKVLARRDGKLMSAIAGMDCYWKHKNEKNAHYFLEYAIGQYTYPVHGTKLLSFSDLCDAHHFSLQLSDTPCEIWLCKAGSPKEITVITHPADVLNTLQVNERVADFWNYKTGKTNRREYCVYDDKRLSGAVQSDWLQPIARLQF